MDKETLLKLITEFAQKNFDRLELVEKTKSSPDDAKKLLIFYAYEKLKKQGCKNILRELSQKFFNVDIQVKYNG